MTNIQTYEENGFFILHYDKSYRFSDDLGIGSSTVSMRFETQEARSLFISLNKQIERLNQLCDSQSGELRHLKSIKGANANLRKARVANRV